MTYTLMVCPHDTASNPERWYLFVQHLAQKLDTHLQFDISLDFADFHENLSRADIVYANPSDTLKLVEAGMTAIARPANLHDEVVFVANPEIANPTLEMLQGETLASVAALQPTKLAMHLLKDRGIAPAGIQDFESWTSVISAIWRNEAKFGLLYKDTYDTLSEQGKSMVQPFFTTDEQVNFHTVLVGNNAAAQQDAIAQVLHSMHTDDHGKEVLQELHVTQWLPVTQEDVDKIRHIMEVY
jgi:ABC-type phosphate/phosphonate transport system substrate-binding protein